MTLGALVPPGAYAAPAWVPTGNVLTWAGGSTITLDMLDCSKNGYSGLVVDGPVTLVHPNPNAAAAQNIRLICPFILFRNGAQLETKEALDVKVTSQIAGPVRLLNTRGEKGADADRTPEFWMGTKKPPGADGPRGSDGRNAETDLKSDWAADAGGNGGNGENGARGANGVIGAPGQAGNSAARIQLKVAEFADGSTAFMHAVGGSGGIGGKGGRGQSGGDGGRGGDGGIGGNGNAVHDGAIGGNGGSGGNGGDGGSGGQGGAGGPGGNGADVVLLILNGGQPPDDIDLSVDGGYGGRGGQGGDYGLGGHGGQPGQAGCSNATSFPFIGGRSRGCGTHGAAGVNGVYGVFGILGQESAPGLVAKVIMGRALPEQAESLNPK